MADQVKLRSHDGRYDVTVWWEPARGGFLARLEDHVFEKPMPLVGTVQKLSAVADIRKALKPYLTCTPEEVDRLYNLKVRGSADTDELKATVGERLREIGGFDRFLKSIEKGHEDDGDESGPPGEDTEAGEGRGR